MASKSAVSSSASVAAAPSAAAASKLLRRPPSPEPTAEQRWLETDLLVVDAETGLQVKLNTKTVLERAEARGDAGEAGAATSAAVLQALPRLDLDAEKSASLHMFIEAQRQRMVEAVRLEEQMEKARREAIEGEPMQWRKRRMHEWVYLDRVDAHKALEKMRAAQEAELVKTAFDMGLLPAVGPKGPGGSRL